ncbi:MAG TPA: DUF2917 domain-containing protein [Anaeromyxobacteraceae bacterium]|nr:DUF2917 domain-containing protein [Anaeromyxobacteraceae bacterium]
MATAMEKKLEVALDSSRAWSSKQRDPMQVEVLEGTVFLTVEGDARDHVISAGDVYQGPPGRRLAAMGLSPSRIRVSGTVRGASGAARPFERFAGRGGRGFARHLLGGTLIVAVWLSLWTWVAAGVVAPLSTIPTASSAATSPNRS